jgi:hypothetical protein
LPRQPSERNLRREWRERFCKEVPSLCPKREKREGELWSRKKGKKSGFEEEKERASQQHTTTSKQMEEDDFLDDPFGKISFSISGFV